MPAKVEYDLLRTTKELEDFRSEWEALWYKDPRGMPFQRPQWLLPWWHQFGQLILRSVVISQSGQPIAFLPFYIYEEPSSGERKLLPLGVSTTDYLDGLFAPECKLENLLTALDLLCAERGWDILYASQLLPGSLLYQALVQSHRPAQQFHSASCSRMPAARVTDLPTKIRHNALYYRNRAARSGKLEFNVADASNLVESFDALQRLHTVRWRIHGEPGVLSDVRMLAWHREAIPQLHACGALRLCLLHLDSEVIAALYSLIDPTNRISRNQYVYITAYSPDHANLSPGTILLAEVLEQAFKEGVQTVDMLRGEEPYKRMWHVETVPTYGFTLRRATALGRHEQTAA